MTKRRGGRAVRRSGGQRGRLSGPPDRLSALPPVGIIGPGRAGLGLALALKRAGVRVLGVHGRRPKPAPRGVTLTAGGAPPWLPEAGVVFLAVRDDALRPLVAELVEAGGLAHGQVALHLSGALTHDVLEPLGAAGAALGSMHPLMTVSEEPGRAARLFKGACFALEGDLRAVEAADALVRRLGGMPAFIAPEAKAAYHAGAVFASNYMLTCLATAEGLLEDAGMTRETARAALLPIARATVDNVGRQGPEAALTGPIARGDVETIRKHLRAMPPEVAALYEALGRATIAIARRAGLDEGRAATVGRALGVGIATVQREADGD